MKSTLHMYKYGPQTDKSMVGKYGVKVWLESMVVRHVSRTLHMLLLIKFIGYIDFKYYSTRFYLLLFMP